MEIPFVKEFANVDGIRNLVGKVDKNQLACLWYWSGLLSSVYTEAEISEFLEKCIKDVGFFDVSLKDVENQRTQMIEDDFFLLGNFYQKIADLQSEDDYDFSSTAFYKLPQGSAYLTKLVRDTSYLQSVPTDKFCISKKDADRLSQLWDEHHLYQHVPSDILFDDGVACSDMELEVSGEDSDGNGVVHSMRVMLFPPYHSMIKSLKSVLQETNELDSKFFFCGLIDIRLPGDENKGFVFQFGFLPRCDYMIMGSRPFTYGFTDDELYEIGGLTPTGPWIVLCSKYLRTWYTMNRLLSLSDFLDVCSPKGKIKDKRKRVSGIKVVQMSRKMRLWDITSEQVDRILSVKRDSFFNGYWDKEEDHYYYCASDWCVKEDGDGKTSETEEENTDIGTTAEDAGRQGTEEKASGTSGTGS